MLENKILQLKKNFSNIIVATDDELHMSVAELNNVAWYKRSVESATDTAPMHIIIEEVSKIVKTKNIVFAPCVSPLFDEFERALLEYEKNVVSGEYDSLIGVNEIREFLLSSDGHPINYSSLLSPPRSQELSSVYSISNSVYMAPTDLVQKNNYWIGLKPYLFKHDSTIDIDSKDDFVAAEKAFLSKVWK